MAFEELIRNARLKGEAERAAKEAEEEEKREGAGGEEKTTAPAAAEAPPGPVAPSAPQAQSAAPGLPLPPDTEATSADANPWAFPPKTDSQKAIAKSQAVGVNPFSGEKVRAVPESAVAKAAREADMAKIMGTAVTPAAPAPGSEVSPPPLEEGEESDDDYIPAGIMQLQSMLNEQEREKGKGPKRKAGIQIASVSEEEIRKSVAKATAEETSGETNVDELD